MMYISVQGKIELDVQTLLSRKTTSPNQTSSSRKTRSSGVPCWAFATFDGHAGPACAHYLKENFLVSEWDGDWWGEGEGWRTTDVIPGIYDVLPLFVLETAGCLYSSYLGGIRTRYLLVGTAAALLYYSRGCSACPVPPSCPLEETGVPGGTGQAVHTSFICSNSRGFFVFCSKTTRMRDD